MLFNSSIILNRLNTELSKYDFGHEPADLYDPIKYILDIGGKRMRPMMTMIAHNFFSENFESALKPALAVEVFHNFTLMHDDIMDDAPLRRSKETVHIKWNTNTAILSGDVMLVKAYNLLMELDDLYLRKGINLFNKCAAEVCEGQQLDVNFEKTDNVTLDEYINMIRLKTAVLLGFSLELGGLMAGADTKNLQLLRELGINIGIGFQLKDDMLDVYGDKAKFGKKVGGDIVANKKTFLLIQALERATGPDLKKLKELMGSIKIKEDEKIAEVTALYNKLNIPEIAQNKIDHYFSEAEKNLTKINAPLYKKNILKKFIFQLMGREN